LTRVKYDNPRFYDFEEHIDFSLEIPYTVRIKKFESDDIVLVHYASTLEILVCKDLKGTVTIDGKVYSLDNGNQVFVITPYTLHSNEICVCDGIEYVIKIDLEMLGNYLNIPNLLRYNDLEVSRMLETSPYFNEVYDITLGLIEKDDDFFECIRLIVSLLSVVSRGIKHTDAMASDDARIKNDKLNRLIKWTEKNYAKKISIDDVAEEMGYSKYYFCTFFRKHTGSSYLQHLNRTRMNNACKLLLRGEPVGSVSMLVGYESVSYFIRLFKSIYGVSPGLYAQQRTETEKSLTETSVEE